MGNDHEADEADEYGPTPRCDYCGTPMLGKRDRANYCTRRCKELARQKRRRGRARVEGIRQKYPHADMSLDELYLRSQRPVSHDQGDEAGHVANDEADGGPGTFHDLWQLNEAIESVRASYERRMEPYRAQLRRNPGVRPPGLVELERQRDDEISRMVRAYEHADEVSRAKRYEPRRINEAHERQMERAALQALGNALPGHRYEAPHARGRATRDLRRW